jgi:hypothetical protein
MATAVQTTLVSSLVQQLPGPLLRALDAWSHRIARRRAEERQRLWLQRKARAAAPQQAPAPEVYHLKPWRD